jgi:hypothetical protein
MYLNSKPRILDQLLPNMLLFTAEVTSGVIKAKAAMAGRENCNPLKSGFACVMVSVALMQWQLISFSCQIVIFALIFANFDLEFNYFTVMDQDVEPEDANSLCHLI